jgi:hypothetical protein
MSAVDGLGGEGVSQPVRVHAVHAGCATDAVNDAADGVSVQRPAVISDQAAMRADVLDVDGGPLAE